MSLSFAYRNSIQARGNVAGGHISQTHAAAFLKLLHFLFNRFVLATLPGARSPSAEDLQDVVDVLNNFPFQKTSGKGNRLERIARPVCAAPSANDGSERSFHGAAVEASP
jgi:hypothetical protein